MPAGYAEAGLDSSRDLKKDDYQLPVSGLTTHYDILKGKGMIIDSSTLQAWRKTNQAAVQTKMEGPRKPASSGKRKR